MGDLHASCTRYFSLGIKLLRLVGAATEPMYRFRGCITA